MDFLSRRARDEEYQYVSATGDELRKDVPYQPWTKILRELFGGRSDAPTESLRDSILSLLADDPLLKSWTPLLEPLLRLGLQENNITAQMDALARRDATAEVIVHLFKKRSEEYPIALALDDGHWIDSASWAAISAIALRVPNVLIVVASRVVDPIQAHLQTLRNRAETELVFLGPLSPLDINNIAAARLGVSELPSELEALLLDKSAGNPFFCEEIVFALRDSGALSVNNGRCALSADFSDDKTRHLPSTVQNVIVSRFDRLHERQKHALKVASVIGRRFNLGLLADICADNGEGQNLRSDLNHLARLDLLRPAGDETHSKSYAFKHAITQEVVYSLMMRDQQKQLHRAVAEWYEIHHGSNLIPYLSLLAFHWHRSGAWGKATEYYSSAGVDALSHHANTEAIQFFSAALKLDARQENSENERRGQWEGYLAEAHLKISDFRSCREHLLNSLRLLGHPVATAPSRLRLQLPWELTRYGLRRIHGALGVSVSPMELSRRRLLAHLHQLRAEVAFFGHDIPTLLHATFRCQAEAESLGPSELLARSHGTMGIVIGVARFRSVARRHCEKGLMIARQIGNLSTLAYVNQLASVHYNGLGDWERADSTIQEAADIYRRLGDSYRWQSALMIRAYLMLYQGRFAEADELSRQVRPVAFPGGSAQVRGWCSAAQMLSELPRAKTDDSLLIDAERAIEDGVYTSEEILVRGTLALAHTYRGEFAEAKNQANAAATLISKYPPPTYYTMGGVASVLAVYLVLCARESDPATPTAQDLMEQAVAAFRHLKRFARRFPFARPRMLLLGGQLAIQLGHTAHATRLLQKSVREGENRAARYDVAVAQLLLANVGALDATGADKYRNAGRRMLAEMGIEHHPLIDLDGDQTIHRPII